jgi:uncharacterized protein (TIGR00299 family) protein
MTGNNLGKTRAIYLDCSAGIAGDMLLAALLDLGASLDYARAGLRGLELAEPWTLEVEEVTRAGIRACRAIVTVAGQPADAAFQESGHLAHDHGHSHYLTGHDEHGQADHDHAGHDHAGQDHAEHDHHHTHHRPYAEIRSLLQRAELPARVKERAQRVFAELAVAEGAVHGVSPDDVHFHEVGSTDAIIDVVGCCLALEELGVDFLEASPLHLGSGFVTAAHGRLPIPAPATLRLLEGLAAYQTDIKGELTTPTGAALVRGLCRRVGPMSLARIGRVGHGAGTKDRIVPNMVRAILVEHAERPDLQRDDVIELASNIDDMNPQIYGPLFDALLSAGALDAWVESAVMKKGRPGHVLKALCHQADAQSLTALMLRETTTLGVRAHVATRVMLDRDWLTVSVAGGEVRVKIGRHGSEVWNVAPEFDDCLALAEAVDKPVKLIIDEAKAMALAELSEGQGRPAQMGSLDGSR